MAGSFNITEPKYLPCQPQLPDPLKPISIYKTHPTERAIRNTKKH